MEHKARRKKHKGKSGKSAKNQKHVEKKNDSGEEFVDLAEELYPIGHYLNNRSEMIQQIFSVMEKEKLNTMLPPLLKGIVLEDLKKMCLEQLEKMPENQILRVLNGESVVQVEQHSSPSDKHSSDEDSSLSSSEEDVSKTAVKQNRTLLDILEQEMQAIAYRTVLKKVSANNSNAVEISDVTCADTIIKEEPKHEVKVLSDVIRDKPNDLDSEARDSSSARVEKSFDQTNDVSKHAIKETLSSENQNPHNIDQSNLNLLQEITAVPANESSLPVSISKSLSSTILSNDKLGESAGAYPRSVSPDPNSSTSLQEDLLVKVFSRCGSSSERMVLKITQNDCRPQVSKNSISGNNPCESKEHGKVNCAAQERRTDLVENEDLIMKEIVIKEGMEIADKQSDFSPKNMSHQTCLLVRDKNNLDSSGQLLNEKEEGELTDLESDNDVEFLEEVHCSSPVLLSSSDEKELADESLVLTRKRKHNHRRSRHKVSGEGKSVSYIDRRIETRGNRNYRCKDSPSPVQNCSGQQETDEPPVSLTSSEEVVNTNNCSSSNTEESTAEIEEEELPHPDSASEEDEASPMKASWADRWANSKDIKKVVTTSKIYTTVRKRILSAHRKKGREQVLPPSELLILPPVPPLVLHVEGSVQEYEMLQSFNPHQNVLDEDQIEGHEIPDLQDNISGDADSEVVVNKENEIKSESTQNSKKGSSHASR